MIVAFIGDEVLDNFNAIDYPREDVRNTLLKNLMSSHKGSVFRGKVYNFAVDGCTLNGLCYGIQPSNELLLSRYTKFLGLNPYPLGGGHLVNQIELIERFQPDYIACSIGMNEGKEHQSKLMWGSKEFLKCVMKDGFMQKFKYLIQKLSSIQSNIIFVLPPKPHKSIFEHYRKSVGWGMQYFPVEDWFNFDQKLEEVYLEFRKIYFTYCKSQRFALIDLYKTINPNDITHYGSTPSSLSNFSGNKLAEIIKHIIDNHDFKGESKTYYAANCGRLIDVM